MRRILLLPCLMALSACAAPTPGNTWDQIMPDPSQAASRAATVACAGPWRPWSMTVVSSEWPYRVDVTETMRCLKDARFVGPFVYRVDGL